MQDKGETATMRVARMAVLAALTVSVLAGLGLLGLGLTGPSAWAQNLFAPVIRVNDRVVTEYEVRQRMRFLEALRAPGVLRDTTLETLIEERLQLDAADKNGIAVSDEDVEAGMEEFAARADLSVEQFIAAIGQEGVDPETFRAFVTAGIAWRRVVQSRFGPRAQITEAEVDRAVALSSSGSSVRVLISEIFLPADTPERLAESSARAQEIAEITTLPAFAQAARTYSISASRGRGGRVDWLPLANLPGPVSSQLLGLAPGEVAGPIPVQNAIALFQLRAIEETGRPEQRPVALEFARFFIPGGRSEAALREAARIAAEVDTCDDLYGVAQGLPDERLLRDVLPVEEISGELALELAKLDEGEVSTALTTGDGQALVFLMLCGRTMEFNQELSREEIRRNLLNQRLASYAEGYLAELRSDAIIREP